MTAVIQGVYSSGEVLAARESAPANDEVPCIECGGEQPADRCMITEAKDWKACSICFWAKNVY